MTRHIRQYVQYSLPDDEYKMFETCRRQEELNLNINLKSAFCLLTLHNCTVKSASNFFHNNPFIHTVSVNFFCEKK